MKLNETDVLIFGWISGNMLNKTADIKNVFKYVDIYFEQQDFDFTNGTSSTRKRVPVKWCTQDDFGHDSFGISTF